MKPDYSSVFEVLTKNKKGKFASILITDPSILEKPELFTTLVRALLQDLIGEELYFINFKIANLVVGLPLKEISTKDAPTNSDATVFISWALADGSLRPSGLLVMTQAVNKTTKNIQEESHLEYLIDMVRRYYYQYGSQITVLTFRPRSLKNKTTALNVSPIVEAEILDSKALDPGATEVSLEDAETFVTNGEDSFSLFDEGSEFSDDIFELNDDERDISKLDLNTFRADFTIQAQPFLKDLYPILNPVGKTIKNRIIPPLSYLVNTIANPAVFFVHLYVQNGTLGSPRRDSQGNVVGTMYVKVSSKDPFGTARVAYFLYKTIGVKSRVVSCNRKGIIIHDLFISPRSMATFMSAFDQEIPACFNYKKPLILQPQQKEVVDYFDDEDLLCTFWLTKYENSTFLEDTSEVAPTGFAFDNSAALRTAVKLSAQAAQLSLSKLPTSANAFTFSSIFGVTKSDVLQALGFDSSLNFVNQGKTHFEFITKAEIKCANITDLYALGGVLVSDQSGIISIDIIPPSVSSKNKASRVTKAKLKSASSSSAFFSFGNSAIPLGVKENVWAFTFCRGSLGTEGFGYTITTSLNEDAVNSNNRLFLILNLGEQLRPYLRKNAYSMRRSMTGGKKDSRPTNKNIEFSFTLAIGDKVERLIPVSGSKDVQTFSTYLNDKTLALIFQLAGDIKPFVTKLLPGQTQGLAQAGKGSVFVFFADKKDLQNYATFAKALNLKFGLRAFVVSYYHRDIVRNYASDPNFGILSYLKSSGNHDRYIICIHPEDSDKLQKILDKNRPSFVKQEKYPLPLDKNDSIVTDGLKEIEIYFSKWKKENNI